MASPESVSDTPTRVSTADGASEFRLTYLPALDGLRAIAVIAVMAVHSNLLTGGWLGVDVFFTLSGFLITMLLLEERAITGRIAFKAFYIRRALRLLPALFLFLTIWTTILVVQFPAFVGLTLGNALAVALYVANWAKIAGFGLGIFAHTWSLAIEEQYYIAWPLLLAFALPRRNRSLAGVLLITTAAAVIYRLIFAIHGATHTRLYEGLDTHADSLLVGGVLAAIVLSGLVSRSPRGQSIMSIVGAAASAALLVLFVVTEQSPHLFFATTLAATATAAVIAAIFVEGFPTTLLTVRPLVALGRISYGVYLWHFPVFFYSGVLIRDASTPFSVHLTHSAAAWTATIAIASLSFRLVERPFLALKPSQQRRLAAWDPRICITSPSVCDGTALKP